MLPSVCALNGMAIMVAFVVAIITMRYKLYSKYRKAIHAH